MVSAVVAMRGSVLYFLVVEMSMVNMTEMSVWSAVVVTRAACCTSSWWR